MRKPCLIDSKKQEQQQKEGNDKYKMLKIKKKDEIKKKVGEFELVLVYLSILGHKT
jgi:hypothetical protein